MRNCWNPAMTIFAVLLLPLSAAAHGGSSGTSIDQHHSELRAKLQASMGDAYDAPVEGLDSADTEEGKQHYLQHCASCHGESGQGDGTSSHALDPLPSDLTNGDQMKFISDAGFVEVIRSGLVETGMPGYGDVLTAEEIVQVYAYTKTLRVETSEGCSVGGTTMSPTGLLVGCVLMGLGIRRARMRRKRCTVAG